MEEDKRHLVFNSKDIRLKDPFWIGEEQVKMNMRLQKLEERIQKDENSIAELTKANEELTKSKAADTKMIA